MGSITRFNLKQISADFDTRFFFETGTWKGDAVATALNFPFQNIYSVEIIPALARQAQARFAGENRVRIFEGSSSGVFSSVLPDLQGNCLFWLDAHYPGADAGLQDYDETGEEHIRLPLETETRLIRALRPHNKDVIIVDDLRIYEDGPYEKGNAPADTLPRSGRGIHFLEEMFSSTHIFVRAYFDEGYLILFPKKTFSRTPRNYFLPENGSPEQS